MSSNPPWPTSKKLRLCLTSITSFEITLMILTFPLFSVMIISLLLINDDPHGSFNLIILVNIN